MRLIFLGTPRFAVPTLDALVAAGHEIRLIVTRPDRPSGRSARLQPPAVKTSALRLGLECHQPAKVRDRAFVETLRAHRPELLVVVAYGRILTGDVLRVAPNGAINLHFSLLPKYRGAAPVQWALARGERETGATTMQINERLDEGDLLEQQAVEVLTGEHAPALQERLADVGAALLVNTISRMADGTLESRAQDEAHATYAPLLAPSDGEIALDLPAREIEGRIRGFDPWPGVWVGRDGKRLRLVEASCEDRLVEGRAAGEVIGLDGEALLVVCGSGSLLGVKRLQPQGGRVMAARDAVNGRHLRPGDRLVRLAE